MLSSGKKSVINKDELLTYITEGDIVNAYLGVTKIPCVINSPLRKDSKPSLGLYSKDSSSIFYTDFATGEKGSLFTLLMRWWGMDFSQVIDKIYNEMIHSHYSSLPNNYSKKPNITIHKLSTSSTKLECQIRDWKDYDLEYWNQYGITLKWLKYADIYPVKYLIFIKDNNRYVFPASKYSYAYVERKNGIQIKIYQPFEGSTEKKWFSNLSDGTISLWNQALSAKSNSVCVCSSMKDALTLWCNYGIPCISPQGEGYSISNTAQNVLKNHFKNIYICYDNDKAGIIDGKKLSEETGFTNIVLPQFEGGKDIADYRKLFGKQQFINLFKTLINYGKTNHFCSDEQ